MTDVKQEGEVMGKRVVEVYLALTEFINQQKTVEFDQAGAISLAALMIAAELACVDGVTRENFLSAAGKMYERGLPLLEEAKASVLRVVRGEA